MCSFSMALDYGRKTWPIPSYPVYPLQPEPWVTPPFPQLPEPIIIEKPVERIPTEKEWEAFLELLDKAAKFDEIAGEADCEDPEKLVWKQRVEQRMAEVREALEDLEDELNEDPDLAGPPGGAPLEGISNTLPWWDVMQKINDTVTVVEGAPSVGGIVTAHGDMDPFWSSRNNLLA